MSELESIQAAVKKAAERRRWQRGWRAFWQMFFIAACTWLVTLGVYKFLPVPLSALIAIASSCVLLPLIGFVYGSIRRMSVEETARWLDEKQHLQERLSTALELAAKPADENWKQLLVSDAARHAQSLDPKKLLPFQLPRITRWALVALILSAGLGFVPEYRSKDFVQKQKDKEVIKEAGAKLVELTKRNLEARPPALEPVRESLQAVEQLGEALAKNPVTRNEALKDLASVTDRVKQELKELGKNPAMRPLEKAAREAGTTSANVPGEMQKQIDNLQKALGDKGNSPPALEKLKQELEQAQKAAMGMPDKNSAEGQAARQQMAQALSDMMKQAQQMGLNMPDLEQAITALQAEQTDLFLKDLDLALQDLEKMQEMSKTLQQLQQAASKLGKDLAEQLKNGQAELAQQTLDKMIQQLKGMNLTEEQLQKLLEEVSKAVKPAEEYGKVGECLGKACSQMKNGNKPGAAQSLADAAEELRKLLEQMGDAQSLMASLESLKRAQMCIGNGQCWSQCKGGNCMKAGQGGKPGRGVGTWAQEEGWIYTPDQVADRWDNSGIYRPDADPRGHTDRGDGDVPDTLQPTKVRGQFSPGGPMPSITLKGLSIKGQSTVSYTEAVTAAQSEAQSAINQDQVPRAYRGAVRDYFDDLKK